MITLQRLTLTNFKNYSTADVTLCKHINCFVGNNGVGKTNLLDAIHYLSLCKSYFNGIDSQNIKHNEDFFVISGNYVINNVPEEVICSFKRNGRKIIKRNKKEYDKLAEHIGLLPVVMITPSDTMLLTEGSDERRRFVDAVISQYDTHYLQTLIRYNRALAQRNKLLKDYAQSGNFDSEMLEVYTDQLVMYGNEVFDKRNLFINEFEPVFQKYYEFISQGNEKVALIYQSQLNDKPLRELLSESINKDRVLEFTSCGIHKDDLLMTLDQYAIKKQGSQGQQKTYVVALKLAEFEFLTKYRNTKPLLLLDDIFDKFDPQRVRQLISLATDGHFGQIFISDTEINRIHTVLKDIAFEHKIFTIDKDSFESIE
jgi:DNA replication and repair protein RecF